MVLLIGNYAPDQQQRMQHFSTMMLEGLTVVGLDAELIKPEPFFGRFRACGSFVAKWLAYLDKHLLFPRKLKARIARGVSLVHICDHSNAVYVSDCAPKPVVVTCHDLLAVRGALGEETDCPASRTGRILQRWILRGLSKATAVPCDSHATLEDAERFLPNEGKKPALSVVTLGLNFPFRKLPADEAMRRLVAVPQLNPAKPFILHVGSNLRRKNRDGVLRIFAQTAEKWDGQLVFAGDPLAAEYHSLAKELGIYARLVVLVHPDGQILEALYNRATALLYPSRFEGFGWPVAEAHACGCPVICSDIGPLPEVAGEASLIHSLNDEAAFATDVLRLADQDERARWSEKSLRNAERFSTARMIAEYVEIYRTLLPQL